MGVEKVELSEHITNTYTPYAMSTIVDRALPDVRDGLKPVHKRILYSMYNKGLRYHKETKAKSTEPVSETMKIHHHGDTSIYDALALMTEQSENLLQPFIDGEGAFGKVYLNDKPSAPRYTYCKLNRFAEEMFKDIDKNAVNFMGEEHKQPSVLPNTYPNILVKPNNGMAVGEACNFGSFNLKEVCNLTLNFIKNRDIDVLEYLKAPDFPTKGIVITEVNKITKIYETGKGSIRIRGKHRYIKKDSIIEIYEIPYNTTVEAIVKAVSELMKDYKAILDVRDETGYNKETKREELCIAIDIRKSADVDKLEKLLYSKTPLETTFSFNMNCLVNYKPKTLGIKEILDHWIEFRRECYSKSLSYEIQEKQGKLYLLEGLEKILLDIDKAISIIRNSRENDMIETLCNVFHIENEQAEYISKMQLRNINKEYIIKQIKDIENLKEEVNNLNYKLFNKCEIDKLIIEDLERVMNTYGQPRMTEIIYEDEIENIKKEDLIEEYNTKLYLTKQDYIKKVMSTSIKSNLVNRVKDDDVIISEVESTNKSDILLFSNKQICYKLKGYELEDSRLSGLGSYLPTILKLEEGEKILHIVSTLDYSGWIVPIFSDGKVGKISLKSYETKTNRSKLQNALCYKELVNLIHIKNDEDIILKSNINKIVIFNTSILPEKFSKNIQGNVIQKQKNNSMTNFGELLSNIDGIMDKEYYRVSKNGVGCYLKNSDKVAFTKC